MPEDEEETPTEMTRVGICPVCSLLTEPWFTNHRDRMSFLCEFCEINWQEQE